MICRNLWAGLVHQPVVNGIERQVEPVRDGELIENAIQVINYGWLVNEKSFGDVVVAIALHHQVHNCFLARAYEPRVSAQPPLGTLY